MELENINDIEIYICAHKDFDCKIHNNCYKIICNKGDNVTSTDLSVVEIEPELSNVGFSEWQKFYFLYKNKLITSKYVGLEHYRRSMKLSDKIGGNIDVNELFKDCDVIVGDIIRVNTIIGQYKYCHNINDLITVCDIINEKFPEYKNAFDKTMDLKNMVICNVMVLSKEDFYDLCGFMFGVLFSWCDKVGIDKTKDESFFDYIDKDISNYSKLHKKDDKTFREQARIPGFLAERLLNVWLIKNDKK